MCWPPRIDTLTVPIFTISPKQDKHRYPPPPLPHLDKTNDLFLSLEHLASRLHPEKQIVRKMERIAPKKTTVHNTRFSNYHQQINCNKFSNHTGNTENARRVYAMCECLIKTAAKWITFRKGCTRIGWNFPCECKDQHFQKILTRIFHKENLKNPLKFKWAMKFLNEWKFVRGTDTQWIEGFMCVSIWASLKNH